MNEQKQRQPLVIPFCSNNDSNNENGVDEWAMIEINGEMIHPAETAVNAEESNDDTVLIDCKNEIELGSLWFDKQQTPYMIVGSHELKGKVETLKQPFCVLEKCGEQADEQAPTKTSYRIKGVITRKLLFQQYPKTILSSSGS